MVDSDNTKLHSPYQDDLDTSDDATDPIMQEENDDPIETLGIPPEEFREELDDLDIDDNTREGNEDARENIEDRDQDMK